MMELFPFYKELTSAPNAFFEISFDPIDILFASLDNRFAFELFRIPIMEITNPIAENNNAIPPIVMVIISFCVKRLKSMI